LEYLVGVLQRGLHDDISSIVVKRSDVLKSLLIAMNKPTFSFGNNLSVVFAGEEAEDQGGPRREFLRYLALLTVVRCHLLY
jgi:hypothetical protein